MLRARVRRRRGRRRADSSRLTKLVQQVDGGWSAQWERLREAERARAQQVRLDALAHLVAQDLTRVVGVAPRPAGERHARDRDLVARDTLVT